MNNFCLVDVNISGLRRSVVYDGEFPLTVREFKSQVLRKQFPNLQNCLFEDFYVLSQTSIKDDEDFINGEGQTYYLLPRLIGGKGGFGSMLRAIGAQIEKTTNREACRDLSGRRMRDINNEKQLKDWMSKQKDREKERAQRKEEKAARRRAEPMHKFEDKLYDQQKEKVSKDLNDALQQGLKRAQASTTATTNVTVTSTKKRKVDDSLQKQWNWIGVTDEDNSLSSNSDSFDDDDDDVTSGAHACPGIPILSIGGDSGASTSAASDHEFCPPLSVEQRTEDSDSRSSLGSVSSSGTTKTPSSSLSKCESQSSAGSEPEPEPEPSNKTITEEKKNITEENIQDLTTVLENATCAEDLQCLGLEKLKLALSEKGMKCGGTLAERAHRLFAVQGLCQDQIDPSFFAKPSKGKGPKKNH